MNCILGNNLISLGNVSYCNCGCKMVDMEEDNTHYDEFGFIDPFSFREEGEQNEADN